MGGACTVPSARCYVPVVHGTPYAVQDTVRRRMEHGAWCVVRGAWCVVRGAWCMVHKVAGSSAVPDGHSAGQNLRRELHQVHANSSSVTASLNSAPAYVSYGLP